MKLSVRNGVFYILRVIAGVAKGHRLKTPRGMATRPTSDRVKEALFNIIAAFVPDSYVLDMFSGTGSLGIEALSRGAAYAVFVDYHKECVDIIKENLNYTKLQSKAKVFQADCLRVAKKLGRRGNRFDIIFMDPPYSKNLVEGALSSIVENGIIKDNGIIVVEHRKSDTVPQKIGDVELVRRQDYGDTSLSFYRRKEISN